MGAFATASRGLRGTLAGGSGLLAGITLLWLWPGLLGFAFRLAVLSLAAGLEVARAGTRISVIVLLGLIVTAMASPVGVDPWILPLAAIGLFAGHAVLGRLGLAGVVPAMRVDARHGLRLALFLVTGVAISLLLVAAIEVQRNYWIAILFVSRALIPFPERREPLLRYGTGAAVGVVAAVLLEAIGLPDPVRLLVAFGALILGIRFMIHPRPIGPAMTTLALLLGMAPTTAEALFRAEAVALVFGIILFVGLILDRLWTVLFGEGDSGDRWPASR